MVFTYSNLNEYKRYLCHSGTILIVVFVAAVIRTELPLQLSEYSNSVCFVAMAVLPLAGNYFGEIICKAIINMVVYIPGALLGYGLCRFSKEGTGGVIIIAIFVILIAPVIFVRSVLKVVMDGYENAPMAFMQAMFLAYVDPMGPDLRTNEFITSIKTLAIAYGLTVFLTWCLSFFAGDEVHYRDRVQENIKHLADICKVLKEICSGQNSVYKNLKDEPFFELLQSLINSEEKNKFFCWEFWLHPHPQEQYENMGDLIRHCAFSILSLCTTVENLHLSTHLRETCKEIFSESEKALALLSDSMKNKTAPAASIDIHLTRLQNLANHLKENTLESTAVLKLTSYSDNKLELTASVKLASHPENKVQLTNPVLKLASHPENTMEFTVRLKLTSYHENIHIISHLLTSVNFIEKLAISIKELAVQVPFRQSKHNSNLQAGNRIGEVDNLGQVAINMDPPTGPVRVN